MTSTSGGCPEQNPPPGEARRQRADAHPGALITLHIINAYGHEIVIPNSVLETFWTGEPHKKLAEFVANNPNEVYSLPASERKSKETLPAGLTPTLKQKKDAAYRALLELGIEL